MVLLLLALLMSVCSVACHAAASAIHTVDAVRTEAVRFQSGGVTLAGTLFIPDERGRHPAIVLFHGSGPEPRNPSVADWFARHGVIADESVTCSLANTSSRRRSSIFQS